jgi:asparagine synthase (glutamine-hydrolysing)
MCGIAGIFGLAGAAVAHQEIKAMCDVLVHRGPDDAGYYVQSNFGFGMRRLSIVDLRTGHQPLSNEDGTIQVILNGEIYNFRELRKELQAQGHCFRTETDTEVIVHLYEQYGDECVHRLRGMFAFAVWDEPQRRLLLARDRIGIKPLFYGEIGGRLMFASELKALLQLPEVDRTLNWDSVSHLFSTLCTPASESIIAGIHKLEPGHTLTVKEGNSPQIRRYWDVKFEADYSQSEEDCVVRLRELLQESVRIRMNCDVPFGAFLSGGVDSSAVVAMMAQQSSSPIKTFSIGFEEEKYNEAPYARQVAELFGTDHHELILRPDILGIIDDLVWHLDEPFGDSSAIPTYMVSRLAAEHVTVALSGDGGDELFAGYEKYLVEQKQRRYERIPAALRHLLGAVGARMNEGMKGRNFLRHIALEGVDRYLNTGSMFDESAKHKLFRPEIAASFKKDDSLRQLALGLEKKGTHWLSTLQYLDIHNYLPQDILTKVDRMSMAHSLEAREPLLDHKLVEYAATIPPEFKLRNGSTKYILKKAMRGILPDALIDRRKQGFAVPLGSWFRGDLTSFVHDLLLSDSSRARRIFNTDYIQKLLSMHQLGRNMDLQLWTLVSFELWCRKFLDQPLVCKTAGRGNITVLYPHIISKNQAVATSNSALKF